MNIATETILEESTILGRTTDTDQEASANRINILKRGSKDGLQVGMMTVDSTNNEAEEAMSGVGREIDPQSEIKDLEQDRGKM